MAKLTAAERAGLPDRAFAYIDSRGRRRLPINDEVHVRNALARFDRVEFEDDAARERARRRLLNAAKRFGILPVGFVASQLRVDRGAPDFSTMPSGSVTFLMSDIEGSTLLAERYGDLYAEILRQVRSMIRSTARRFGGRRVDAHGDEYLSVFEAPAPALLAAVDLQRALGRQSWPGGAQCRIRIGVHTGRPTLTESGYVGVAMSTVARVCNAGHGGQIVVTGATKAALGAAAPDAVRLRSLGRRRLLGLSQPVPLYQAFADGLATSFPPLRTR